MDTRVSPPEGTNRADIGFERSDYSSARAHKPGRRPEPKEPAPDCFELIQAAEKHFLPELKNWLKNIKDPRRLGRVTFPIDLIFRLVITMRIAQYQSRREFGKALQDGQIGAAAWEAQGYKGEDIFCHHSTVNRLMEMTPHQESETLIENAFRSMVQARVFDPFRYDGMLSLAVDGTNTFSSKTMHCEHCLTQKHSGTCTTFRHDYLACKLVSLCGFIAPVAFEPIENPDGTYTKQDCEIKAWRRLLPKLKEKYPRMKFNILADSLFAEEETFTMCDDYGYNFFISLKDDKLPSVRDQLPSLDNPHIKWTGEKTKIEGTGADRVATIARWKTPTYYHGRIFHVFQYEELDCNGKRIYFNQWITNVKPDSGIVFELSAVARLRWKIENEGTNTQKNCGYEMEHLYGRDPNAMKNYYLLLQLAQMLTDLVRFTDLIAKFGKKTKSTFSAAFGTIRHFAELLRATVRTYTSERVPADLGRIQVRFLRS